MTDVPNKPTRAQRPGRRVGITEAQFNPSSLVGSWLHILEDEKIVADGLIVAEPATGVFLVEVTEDGRRFGRLYSLRAMIADGDGPLEFRFYDSDSEMREAYADWLTKTEREQA